jgi:phosphatidylglycerophosphatase A
MKLRATRDAWMLVPFVAYAAYSALRSDLRVEHVFLVALVAVLAFVGPRTRELLRGLFPLGLVALLFDGMRPYQKLGLTESRVLVCDLRDVEARVFGARGSTLQDYFHVHHSLALDVFCAIPYATFVFWCIAGAIVLYVKDRPAMMRFAWGFFLLNVVAFATYHLLPAAPPWYFHEHGCAVDLAARASEGPALARVDRLLGVPYFHGMYGKASSVFGALPSLHCAYPLLLLLVGWRAFGPRMRAAALAYWIAMVFSAVYLDHHWLLDAALGSAYTVVVVLALSMATRERVAFVTATWFGTGLSPVAPGTVGTLAALPLYFVLRDWGPLAILAAAGTITLAGVWAAGIVADRTGRRDPQIVVVDEVAGVLLALTFATRTAFGVALAVLLFRVFDITKPFPARAAERLPRGWGIVVDDIVAGGWAAAIAGFVGWMMTANAHGAP